MKFTKFRSLTWMLLGIMVGALLTVQFRALARDNRTTIPLEQMQQLATVFGMIKQDYVEPIQETKMIKDAITGMVSGLDPHSAYLDEKEYKEFREGTSGQFVGIGIEIGMEDGYIKVISPIEDTPAFRAGLKSGDLITNIDSTPVKGMTIEDAVKRIRGLPGTPVQLNVYRKSEQREFPVTIVRGAIVSRSIKGKVVEPGYGWIRINQFQEKTVEDFVKKVDEIYKESPDLKGLVLDMRNDPGGLLDAAIAISAAFLPADVTVVSTKGQIPESNQIYKASPVFYSRGGPDRLAALPAALKKVPVVVLVNEGSASASEIVAAALQDYKRAKIMGHTTFGKGSVQTIRNINANTALKLTTARYYTPSGRTIQALGVQPDIAVDEYENGDPLAVLRTREADLNRQIGGAVNSPDNEQVKKEREAARKILEDEKRRILAEHKPYSYGEQDDFQLKQAINHLKGLPVILSKQAASTPKS